MKTIGLKWIPKTYTDEYLVKLSEEHQSFPYTEIPQIPPMHPEWDGGQDSWDLVHVKAHPILWGMAHLNSPFSTRKKDDEPWVPRGLQIEMGNVVYPTFYEPNKRVAILAARRRGKTVGAAVIVLHRVMETPGTRALIITPAPRQLKNFFEDYIWKFIDTSPELKGQVERRTASPNYKVTFKNGSSINGFSTGAHGQSDRSNTLRSEGADIVYIDEMDYIIHTAWKAIDPIIDDPDVKPIVLATTTPAEMSEGARFYQWFHNEELYKCAHVWWPLTRDPDIKYEDMIQIRNNADDESQFKREYMAIWESTKDSVYSQGDITRAMSNYNYGSPEYVHNGNVKIMGVDWDKFSSGSTIAVVEYDAKKKITRLIDREDVPQGEYSLDLAVKTVASMARKYRPAAIYVDRGFGDSQIEQLMLYDKKHPEHGLNFERVLKPVHFNESVEIFEQPSGQYIKKHFKQVMVNRLSILLQRGRFRFPSSDGELRNQLNTYKIVSFTARGPQFTKHNDHMHDATGLAVYGTWELFYEQDYRAGTLTMVDYIPPERNMLGVNAALNVGMVSRRRHSQHKEQIPVGGGRDMGPASRSRSQI